MERGQVGSFVGLLRAKGGRAFDRVLTKLATRKSCIGYESSPVAVVRPKAELAAAAEIADKTAREAVANLQQTIQELRAEQQRVAEQISGLQRQISAEQGERKLLSEQLGGLSARVDSLQGSNAAAPLNPPQPAKKGRGQ
jgi:uncharacterized coiled-coil protein SlyX